MVRNCVKYKSGLEVFKKGVPELNNSNVEIYFDTENEKAFTSTLAKFLKIKTKRLHILLSVILKGIYIDHIYKREDKGVTVIKEDGQKRFYCREINEGNKKIVIVSFFKKKVKRNQDNERLKNLIETIKEYEYEFTNCEEI